tara:strand:- start:3316 stop:3672 length:357 start_codon:yes stop_codon:yes gene_type:complete
MVSGKDILKRILDEDPAQALKDTKTALYLNVGKRVGEERPTIVARNFKEENYGKMVEAELSPEQEAFRSLFKKMLDKHGVDSPNELDDEKKAQFYDEVEKAWEKDPKNDNEGEGEEQD